MAPDTGRPYPADARSNDQWFQHVAIIVSDMAAAYARLRDHGVTHISSAPQTLPDSNPDAGGISAFYFKDPSGNPLEILHFPPDKGADRWHRDTDALFLGIDHTAIAVKDTKTSLAFYRDQLGFTVAGTSTNYGIEQERLTGVFGAWVRITALRAPGGGMGVEFLEYVAPSDGRPFPQDTQANDRWHGHIRISTDMLTAQIDTLMWQGVDFVSPGVQALPTDALGFRRGALLRDPTGHGVLMTAPPAP
ncbi:MAG: glyoxalase [Bacteroidetes bacterium]|nr:glyoxalase [Bacteroidota bacterium]